MRLREHLSYANVISTIALFAVLGGGSYAATELSKNEVKSKYIAKKAVKTKHVAKNAIKTGKIADGAVTVDKLAEGATLAGEQGPQGPQGPKGDTGPQGAAGDDGSAVAYATVRANGTLVADQNKNITAENLDPDTQVGTYCFTGLSFTPKSAVATVRGVGSGAAIDGIATTYVGNVGMVDCVGTAAVMTYDVGEGSLEDRAFTVWFED